MTVLYEDNHIIIVSKAAGEIVQGDKTGDKPLSETVKEYIKERYHKPGSVFLGVVHRLDRPVSGIVLFARTSKALSRLNALFADHESVHKTYWAIVANRPEAPEGTLVHWLTRNEKTNKATAFDREVPRSKKAVLDYRLIASGDRYHLLEVTLRTGRHHQIRCQFAARGWELAGERKYSLRGDPWPLALWSCRLCFLHPRSGETLNFEQIPPDSEPWTSFNNLKTVGTFY